jgi:Sec-independent protein translocase protein TatA
MLLISIIMLLIFGAGNVTQMSEGIGKIIKHRLQEVGARRGGGSQAA